MVAWCRPDRGALVAASVTAAVFAADALTKALVLRDLAVGEVIEVVPGWLVLTHVRNTGVAYGLLADQAWLTLPLQTAAAALAPVLLWRSGLWQVQPLVAGVASGLILGGALGNLVERLRAGSVTDFIQVVPVPLFQVFNLADAAICTGVVVLFALSRWPAPQPTAPAQQPAER